MDNTIQILRGESVTLNIGLTDTDGNVYFLQAGEILRFGVKLQHHETEYRILKELTADDAKSGVYPVTLLPADTQNMRGKYYYDVGVQNGDNYYLVIEKSTFEVQDAITKWEAPDGA